MKHKALTIIVLAVWTGVLAQLPAPAPGVTMPTPPQPASLMPNVVIGFPQPNTAPNPFGVSPHIQQQNDLIMQEVMQHEQRRLQQQQLFAEIERDILQAQVQYELPDLSRVEGTEHYRQAFAEITDMLEGKKPLDLKRAVFLVENAYFGNRFEYGWFNNDVLAMKEIVQDIVRKEGYSPDDDLAKKWALHRFLSDTVEMKDDKGKTYYTHTPFGYDFDDPFGKEDWSKMFVTKLVKSKKGQCHSLPLLYLILAEQLGVEAYLSFAPQHSYLRLQGANGNWYNLELTVGRYSSDSWLTGSGFIKAEALLHKLYMDTLGKKEVIADCLFDLAKGYTKKYGFDGFVQDCTKKSLEHHPSNIFALQLYSDYHTVLFHHVAKQLGFPKLEELQKNQKANELYLLRNQIYDLIDQSGFEPMPEEAYLRWLQSFETEAARQPKELIKP
jgi:hypothetical protein